MTQQVLFIKLLLCYKVKLPTTAGNIGTVKIKMGISLALISYVNNIVQNITWSSLWMKVLSKLFKMRLLS